MSIVESKYFENVGVGKDHAKCLPASTLMGVANKLERNSFHNILAMKISVVVEFDSTNISSADTNLDTFRFYQKF